LEQFLVYFVSRNYSSVCATVILVCSNGRHMVNPPFLQYFVLVCKYIQALVRMRRDCRSVCMSFIVLATMVMCPKGGNIAFLVTFDNHLLYSFSTGNTQMVLDTIIYYME
jgi:hypothetical protein